MKSSTVTLFAALFLVVAIFYVSLNYTEHEVPKIRAAADAKLLVLEKGDEITKLEIQNSPEKRPIRLERHGKQWVLTEPVQYPADHRLVEGLVGALTFSVKARRFGREKDWQEYGLSKPSLKVVIGTARSKRPRVLAFGDHSPVGNFVYARWEPEEEYFLLSADMKRVFERSVYSLREKKIFQFPFSELSRVNIRTFQGEFEMTKRGGNWLWLEPVSILGERVANDYVDAVMKAVDGLYVNEFLDAKKKAEDLNLSLLAPSIALTSQNGKVEILQIGREMKLRDAYYAKKREENAIFLVAKPNIDFLFETVERQAQPPPSPMPSPPASTRAS